MLMAEYHTVNLLSMLKVLGVMVDINYIFIWLTALEDFIIYRCSENLKGSHPMAAIMCGGVEV